MDRLTSLQKKSLENHNTMYNVKTMYLKKSFQETIWTLRKNDILEITFYKSSILLLR
jgi:hypothetical protein